MTGGDVHAGLQAPWQTCEAARADLLALLEGLSRRDWNARRSAEAWSVGEYVDHLIRAEVGTSKMARRLIRGDYRDVKRPREAQLFDSRLAEYPYGRYPAPAGLTPEPLAMEDATDRLDAVHRRFLEELLAFKGVDADELAAEDPDTGLWFTLAGWVKLQGLHEAHHVAHIRAVLSMR